MISFKTCMRVLSDMARPIRWRMAVTILAGMVRITASLSFVVVSKLLVDIATGASAEPLGKGILAFLGVLALQIGCAIFSNWWESYFEVKSLNQMREALFARTIMQSSPVSMLQFDILTSREQFTCMPSAFGKSTSALMLRRSNTTSSQSWTQKLQPAGG